MSGTPEPNGTAGHYERLAATYDSNWTYSPAAIAWMTSRLTEHAAIRPGDTIVDIGCGTGLYSRELARTAGAVICADPSQAMLNQIPASPSLIPVGASAQDIAAGRVTLPVTQADAIVMKEAVHHIPADERERALRGLARLLRPGGRILVVMLPATISYPLFAAALERFERDQPDPGSITATLTTAGLDARLTYEGYDLAIPKARYLAMVRARYMSLLSSFTDADIERGIAEITERHPGDPLRFTDRFAFIHATQSAQSRPLM